MMECASDERSVAPSSAFKLSSSSALDDIAKQKCPSCAHRRMYFCYDCRAYMPGVDQLAPHISKKGGNDLGNRRQLEALPVSVDIIKHHGEKNAKSTALHCLLLAPSSTRLFDSPDVLDYRTAHDRHNTVLVYPSRSAVSVEEFVQRNGPIKRFVFLDATWFQVGGLKMLPEIQNLPTVTLRSYKTLYWRPQKGYSDEHLATIEAIYYALREAYEAHGSPQPYDGRFDDLLFWFFHFRSKVPQAVFHKNLDGRESVTL